MTTLYVGHRLDVLEQGTWDYIGNLEEDLVTEWRQLAIRPQSKIFFGLPSEPLRGLSPKPGYDLALEMTAITEPWRRWCRQRNVPVTVVPAFTQDDAEALLKRGIRHLSFTEPAITQFLSLIPVMHKRRFMDLLNLLLLGYPEAKRLTPRDVVEVLGGEVMVLASQYVDALGDIRSFRIARRIALQGEDNAVSLLKYTQKILESKQDPRVLLLHLCMKGADDLRWTYKSALQMFALYCLNTSVGKEIYSGLPTITERTLDLCQVFGIPLPTGGSTRDP